MNRFNRRVWHFAIPLFFASSLNLFLGCSSDEGLGPEEPVNTDSLVQVANNSLAVMMNEVINQTLENLDSTFRPNDVDFTGALALYEQALASDPNNNDALFGAAFCGLMSFLADSNLNELYERFKTLNDTGGFFPVGSLPQVTLGNPLAVTGFPLHPNKFTDMLIDITRLDPLMARAAAADPTISEIQALLETSLLPKVQKAQERIADIIANNPNFEFVITSAMQGNPGANPIVVDLADFRVILGSLHAIEAAIHVFVARNLDLSSYTVDGIQEALQQNSSFLSLKEGNAGAASMSAAKIDILIASDQALLALDALLAEIAAAKDQTNDLIKVSPADVADLNDIKDTIEFFQSFFDGPKILNVFWNGDYNCYYDYDLGYYVCIYTEDTLALNVDASKLFDDPLDNPKQFVPDYSLTLTSNGDAYKEFAQLHFSRDAYWDSLASKYGISYPNDTAQVLQQYGFYYHLPDENNDFFYELLTYNYYNQAIFGWDDVANYGYSSLYVWDYYSNNYYHYSNLYWNRNYWTLCYAWSDLTWSEWTWPEPTFNGLFPGLTSDRIKNEILPVLGIDAGNWIQSDCGNINPDISFSDF